MRNDAKIELKVPFREIAVNPMRNMQDDIGKEYRKASEDGYQFNAPCEKVIRLI